MQSWMWLAAYGTQWGTKSSVHENVYAQYINSSTQNYTLEHKYKQKVGTEQKQTKTVSR